MVFIQSLFDLLMKRLGLADELKKEVIEDLQNILPEDFDLDEIMMKIIGVRNPINITLNI